MPKYHAHVPTRYMTVVEVAADTALEALQQVVAMQGVVKDVRFVEFLFDEIDEYSLDMQPEEGDG